jgi:hypothetical protein
LPGKHVDINSEKGDEREFLFAVEITRDMGRLTSLSLDQIGLYEDIFLARGLYVGCWDRATLARARWCGVLATRLYSSFMSYYQSPELLQCTSPYVTISPDPEDEIGWRHL